MALSSRDMVRIFRALSDPTRVEIVQLVSKSPRNVTELTSLVGVSQPKVSRHLKILRDAGLLNDVRKGKWVWYEMVRHSGREPGSTIAVAMSMFFHAGAVSSGRGARSGGGAPAGTVPAGGVPVSAMPEGTVSRRTASRVARGAVATSASVESGSAGSEGAASTGARRRETAHKAKPARGTRPRPQRRADKQTETQADKPTYRQTEKPAVKRADKPTRRETPPSRRATSGTPTKDLEDFLL